MEEIHSPSLCSASQGPDPPEHLICSPIGIGTSSVWWSWASWSLSSSYSSSPTSSVGSIEILVKTLALKLETNYETSINGGAIPLQLKCNCH